MKRFTIHVFLPVIFGGIIYILWRSDTLLLFKWASFLGAGPVISVARAVVHPLSSDVPSLFFFSLPAALWLYATTSSLNIIWEGRRHRAWACWVLLALFIALGSEIAQAADLIPGTFDLIDTGSYVAAWLFSILFFRERRNRET